MVGYAIGEYIENEEEKRLEENLEEVYEIVTAWINPKYVMCGLLPTFPTSSVETFYILIRSSLNNPEQQILAYRMVLGKVGFYSNWMKDILISLLEIGHFIYSLKLCTSRFIIEPIHSSSYRRLHLSTEIYLQIIKMVSSRYVTFDLLNQHVERVVQSSFFLRVLRRIVGEKYIVVHRFQSYDVQTENGIEQFEKVTLNRPPIFVAMEIVEYCSDYKYYLAAFCFLIFAFFINVFLCGLFSWNIFNCYCWSVLYKPKNH